MTPGRLAPGRLAPGRGSRVQVGWIFGVADFSAVMEARTGWRPSRRLGLLWRYVGPAVLSVLFVVGVFVCSRVVSRRNTRHGIGLLVPRVI